MPGFNDIITAIATVGFPIVGCVYLIYANRKNTEDHKEEVKELAKSLNENTDMLIHLSDVIEGKEK